MDTKVERLLSKAYKLEGELGTGGFGLVVLATHLLTLEKVAIKIMNKTVHVSELKRMYREVRALTKLNHPHICQLYQVIEIDDFICLVMEYCPSGELFDYIIERECIPEDEACRLMSQMVSVIAYIHSKGYAHRDLKPENIMLDKNNNIKLIDFGLCAKPKGSLETKLMTCCGSIVYAAPELLSNNPYYGHDADIWSLGIILFILIAGNYPFQGQYANEICSKIESRDYKVPDRVSIALKALIFRMLEVDPANRISIGEIAKHQWFNRDRAIKEQMKNLMNFKTNDGSFDKENLNIAAVDKLANFFCVSREKISEELSKEQYNYLSASYLLMLKQKKSNRDFFLNENFNFSKVFHRTKMHMKDLLQDKKQDPLFKVPAKNKLLNPSLTPCKKVNTKVKLLNQKESVSPSLKVLKSIGKLFGSQSPLKNIFKEKNEIKSEKIRRKLDYTTTTNQQSLPPKLYTGSKSINIFKVPSEIKINELLLALENILNDLKLVYMRTKDVFLIEKLSQSTFFSQLASSKTTSKTEESSIQTNFTENSMTTLKICLTIVNLNSVLKDGKTINQLGIARKRLSGESWFYKSINKQIFSALKLKFKNGQ